MDTRSIQRPIKQFVSTVSKKISVDEIILFGSRLEGTAKQDSDIDIFVISRDFESLPEDQRMDILYEARQLIEPEIHPWGFSPKELDNASTLTTLGHARQKGKRIWIQGQFKNN